MNRRDFLKSTLTAGTALLLAACSSGAPLSPPASGQPPAAAAKPTPGGSVTFVLENDVIDFDPLRSRAFVDRNVHYQIYDSLVRIDASGKVIPGLAEQWQLSQDGQTLTFTLRKGVKFHDGNPFDADAVKWNIDRYRTTEGSARTGELAPVASVDVVDGATVRFNLKSPFSPLPATLVDRAGMMVSPKAVEAGGADFTRKAFRAGTGPFILTEAVKDDHITLERNPEWWDKDASSGALPYLDKITIKPITNSDVRFTNLRTGSADVGNSIAGKDVAAARAESAINYREVPGVRWDSLNPNRKAGFVFEEPRYVKAVAAALDRKEIVEKAFFGFGSVSYGAIAPTHFAHDPNFKPYETPDPELAKRLVAEVGRGPLSFEYLVSSGDPVLLQIAQLIQAQLGKADINAEIVQLEFAQILQQQNEKSFKGMTQIAWSGRVDPDGNTYDQIYTGRPTNDSAYSNKEVDQLLDQQRAISDEAKRRELLRRAEQIYAVDDPARVWYRFGASQLITAKRLQGLEPYPDAIVRLQYGWLQK
jgi:peptide/nickel transport system substrate-binding protein